MTACVNNLFCGKLRHADATSDFITIRNGQEKAVEINVDAMEWNDMRKSSCFGWHHKGRLHCAGGKCELRDWWIFLPRWDGGRRTHGVVSAGDCDLCRTVYGGIGSSGTGRTTHDCSADQHVVELSLREGRVVQHYLRAEMQIRGELAASLLWTIDGWSL